MMRKILQNSNNNNKWNLFTYDELLKEAGQQGLLEPIKDDAVAGKVNVYTRQNTIFLIIKEDNNENAHYTIYYFTPSYANILGQGAYATVFAGKNLATGEDVAIKTNNDEVKRSRYQYSEQPAGWSLAKNKLNAYEHFAKVLHFGSDFRTSGTNDKKYYLIMERLKLYRIDKKICDREHLQLILNKAFDAITIMYNLGIYGIDWIGMNLHLDALGNPRFIDYDNLRQTDNDKILIQYTNESYSHLIKIIEAYYSEQGASIGYKSEYYNKIEEMKELIESMQKLISKKAFFEITNKLIEMGEEKLAQKASKTAVASLRI